MPVKMKDKLIKNGHKGIYYKARRFFLFTIIAALVFAGASIATYISISEHVKAQEESETKEIVEENKDSESDSLELTSYTD